MSEEGGVWTVMPAMAGLGKDVFAEHYGAPDGSKSGGDQPYSGEHRTVGRRGVREAARPGRGTTPLRVRLHLQARDFSSLCL